MAFINKKEEVIQIQLTQYGKNLLSRGKFKPMYYSFYDDEIIYDSAYAGFLEDQNEAEARIKEAPRHNLRTSLISSEKKLKQEESTLNEKNAEIFNFQSEKEKQTLLSSPLGHMKLGEQACPHFIFNTTENVIAHGLGDKDKGVLHITGSNSIKIPQINVEVLYETFEDREVKADIELFDSETFIDLLSEKIKFLDGTGLRLEKDKLIFELIEENVSYEKSNFEVEIFEVSKGTDSDDDVLIPIKKEEEINDLFKVTKDESVSKQGLRGSSTIDRGFFVKD